MNEYMLIFRHEDASGRVSPEQMQQWMEQARAWIDSIISEDKYIGGNGLPFQDARVVHHNNVVTNGPFGDIKETIGGYIIVRAETVDEAVGFAKGSPVLQGPGNTVEVRMISSKHNPE